MNKLFLEDKILLQVEKPARYIGNEVNAIYKNENEVAIRFALCFPDVYDIGMSHLGLSILYNLLNQRDDLWCERVFSPWVDLDRIMEEEKLPLFALESQEPIKTFDFIGITIQYEMCYTNILRVLDLAQIPLLSKDRTEDHPLVCAGGPCVYNPEPISDFIDFFYIGEGEVQLDALMDAYKFHKESGGTKKAFLEIAATFEGIYVPAFYEVSYNEDGTIESFLPNNPNARPQVKKVIMMDMTGSRYPMKPIVPYIQTVHDRVVLELFRGCARGCRFCQAGIIYRPVREKDLEALKEQAIEIVKNTGHDEISLISLSSSDYSHLNALASHLIEAPELAHVNLSLPSLRIDDFSIELMSKVQDVRKSSLTFAPEAGSQRMRDVINKNISEEDILKGAYEAFMGGWNRVKMYFMLGLPTETEEDVLAIAKLGQDIVNQWFTMPGDMRKQRLQVVLSTSFFIPKPFTPFQWMGQASSDAFLEKSKLINRNINKKNIKYNSHDADTSRIEGVLARGDRKLNEVILKVYQKGARYDAWSEHFDVALWNEAFADLGMDSAFYNERTRELEEILPWDFIDVGVNKSFLHDEFLLASKGETTVNCLEGCTNCGAMCFEGGICYARKA
ncbi:MAG: B12-binding domain-containing radical SAM protein [Firmicutes bacterium HGW-Firmicutes-2]|jgi:radical SAM family uncharacterized protein|nr:MAG: B12-binding domain-containing radical SAM protein [Firmicutes bacterium HGW-Firmicutes-2]